MKKQLIVLLCIIVTACSPSPPSSRADDPQLVRLFDLIDQRLSYMEDVAAWKWVNRKPIEDLEREAAVLSATQQTAVRYGLDGPSSAAFINAQMDAAKVVQVQAMGGWRKTGFDNRTPPDLATDLRPAIIKAGDQILMQISLVLPKLSRTDLAPYAAALSIPPVSQQAIIQGLTAIRYRANFDKTPFGHVMDSGVLRVGTTGDYAPFSTVSPDGRHGIDIDLAAGLAAYLGVHLVFADTSWPSLLEDLIAERYDIGMSGISIMSFRQEVGHMTSPYHTGGKTPIIRCEDADKLSSVAAIDSKGVRVIVNPGGTNERFTRANIHTAAITIFDDNAEIFDEIAEGRADAMFTDAIEVSYQTARKPSLCPALQGETLTTAHKGYLMPKDDLLLLHVNNWLKQITENGSLQATFDDHLGVHDATKVQH